MSEQVKSTYWISDSGGIGVWSERKDASGVIVSTSGVPLPKGTRPLKKEALVEHIANEIIAERDTFNVKELARAKHVQSGVARRSEIIDELVASGISIETAEVIVPSAPAYNPREYQLQAGFNDHLRSSYGLDDDDIDAIDVRLEG